MQPLSVFGQHAIFAGPSLQLPALDRAGRQLCRFAMTVANDFRTQMESLHARQSNAKPTPQRPTAFHDDRGVATITGNDRSRPRLLLHDDLTQFADTMAQAILSQTEGQIGQLPRSSAYHL
jgi:hypothetical protein